MGATSDERRAVLGRANCVRLQAAELYAKVHNLPRGDGSAEIVDLETRADVVGLVQHIYGDLAVTCELLGIDGEFA